MHGFNKLKYIFIIFDKNSLILHFTKNITPKIYVGLSLSIADVIMTSSKVPLSAESIIFIEPFDTKNRTVVEKISL